MKNKPLVKTLLSLFGISMIVFEIVVLLSRQQFDQLGDIGWLIHGGLMMSIFGVAVLNFFLVSLIDTLD